MSTTQVIETSDVTSQEEPIIMTTQIEVTPSPASSDVTLETTAAIYAPSISIETTMSMTTGKVLLWRIQGFPLGSSTSDMTDVLEIELCIKGLTSLYEK